MGLFGAILIWLLVLTRRIKIKGYDKGKLEPGDAGLILVHNHPSLWEPLVFPFFFFPRYMFSYRYIPYSTPDKENYYDKWWFFPIRMVCIPVKRGSPREEVVALRDMRARLAQGKILVLAPEGGRTFKGTDFKIIRDGKIEVPASSEDIDFSDDKYVRRFKPGIAWLITKSKARILPIWTEGGDGVLPNSYSFRLFFPRLWRQTVVNIGEPVDVWKMPRDELTVFLEDSILGLADEPECRA